MRTSLLRGSRRRFGRGSGSLLGGRSLGGDLLGSAGALLARPVHLEVGHQLLLLREHGLKRVELRLQLLDGDLALANRCRRILQNSLF